MSISRNRNLDIDDEIEEITVSNIVHLPQILRSRNSDISELSLSIERIGLLHPILVRISEEGRFEIVAGNRRYDACKSLSWKKILCHIVELDDKTAFEVALAENIQRHTLDPLDEALAFKKYVNDFGWGGVSDLAQKISKSPKYVCRHIKLLELPKDVLDLIRESEIHISTAEELLSIDNKEKQSQLAYFIKEKGVTSKNVRKLIRSDNVGSLYCDELFSYKFVDKREEIAKAFERSIIALRIALNKLAMIIEKLEDNWILYEILMQHRNMLHAQIDLLIREKKKCRVNRNLFSE